MQEWKIDTGATAGTASEVKANLEKARDEWVETTPQKAHLNDENHLVRKAYDQMAKMHNENRKAAAELLAERIKTANTTLGATHTACKQQMTDAIAALDGILSKKPTGTYWRAALSGHSDRGNEKHVDERVNISYEQARPPVDSD